MPRTKQTHSANPPIANFWLLLLNLFMLLTVCDAKCDANTPPTKIDLKHCPKPDSLFFKPLVPQNPDVVLGRWHGKNDRGLSFESMREPFGSTTPAGRDGKMLELVAAVWLCATESIRCDYLLKNTYGHTINQRLISQTGSVVEAPDQASTSKMEL